MVIVAGWIDVAPDQRGAYLESRLAGVLATRSEPGCIDYVFSPDPHDPGRLRLFERWESQQDLDVHLQLLRSRPPAAGGFEVLGREVVVYEVGAATPLQ